MNKWRIKCMISIIINSKYCHIEYWIWPRQEHTYTRKYYYIRVLPRIFTIYSPLVQPFRPPPLNFFKYIVPLYAWKSFWVRFAIPTLSRYFVKNLTQIFDGRKDPFKVLSFLANTRSCIFSPPPPDWKFETKAKKQGRPSL